MVRLEPVELQEGAEEAARRQPQAAHEVRAEDDSLALLWRWRYLPLRHGAGAHEVYAREAARLAEELDDVVVHLGAVPHAGVHGSRCGGGGRAHHRKRGVARCGGGKRKKKQEGSKGSRGDGRACFAAPFLPPTYRLIGLRNRWGGRGINCAPAPTPPMIYHTHLLHAVTARETQPSARPQQIRSHAEAW